VIPSHVNSPIAEATLEPARASSSAFPFSALQFSGHSSKRCSTPRFLYRHCPELNKQAGEVELRVVLGDAAIRETVEFDARELYFAAGGGYAVE
jgi:hypothetical protein